MRHSRHVLFFPILISCMYYSITAENKKLYSNTWAVQIEGGPQEADRIAKNHDYINLGPLGSLEGFYIFRHDSHPRRSKRSVKERTNRLSAETNVRWAEQQVIKKRVKRDYNPHLNDPLFNKQWFLHNSRSLYQGYDHNVLAVWEEGVFGRSAVVSILDDGIEYTHSDLKQNYDPLASYDYINHDADPMPRDTWDNENRHGTRCAGEVAAQFNNSVCTAGVAPFAKIGGVRMLDGDVTDAVEGSSLSLNPQHIDIYSASWGPDDNGGTVDGPARLARKAFTDGVQRGRGGKGSIYVWASGNGGQHNDNCNCDGYTNSIYTLSISSATEHGLSPWYSEWCSSTLATAFSSGNWQMRKIVTTDLKNGCTESHTGTSASAPLAAGILALALEVNHNLTWRDMQHLVVRTATMDHLEPNVPKVVNGVGRRVSHKFGYGLLDAKALVDLARVWKTVPPQHICYELPQATPRPIPDGGTLTVITKAKGCSGTDGQIRYLEHVEAIITLTSARRGDLSIYLTSPSGTRSTLLAKRSRDNSRNGFHEWAFMTTHSWEENPVGIWTLEITTEKRSTPLGIGPDELKNFQLKFYGTLKNPNPEALRKQPVPACDAECEGGCTGPQADHCNQCKHYKRNITGECVASCSKNEYVDQAAKQCKLCSFTCATCKGSGTTNCLSCLFPLILLQGECDNFCPEGWFKFNATCMKCASSCKACAGTASQCSACNATHKLVQSKCVRNCASGQFVDKGKCTQCHSSCVECSHSGQQGCIKCGMQNPSTRGTKSLFLHHGECKQSCPARTYPDDASHECKKCDASCSSCAGAGKGYCVTCVGGLFRVGYPHGTCSQSCPEGHYSHALHGVCVPCTSSCATCDHTDPNKCTSCPNNNYLYNSVCLAAGHCPKGTYANSTARICDPCYSTCAACTDSTDQQCSACSEGYHLLNSRCVLRCPEKTFKSFSGRCQPCPTNCQTCYGTNTTHCLSCVPSHVLWGSQCVSNCPEGTFHDQTTHQCRECDLSCATCNGSSPSNCLKCKVGWKLKENTCQAMCLVGKYSTKKGCEDCHTSCLSCTGPSDRNCIGCKGVKFLDIVTNSCSYGCPEGYYGEAATALCKACPPGCKSCHETGECRSCRGGLVLHEKTCKEHCLTGMYRKDETNSCEKCDPSCLECTKNQNSCIKCRDHHVLSAQKCIKMCPGSYVVKETKQCGKCHGSCAECAGPAVDDCTKCSGVFFKVGSRCLKSCPPQYYYDAKREQCEPCNYYCQMCKEGNGFPNCSKCILPFVLHDNNCVRNCPKQDWFLDSKEHRCLRCHRSCSTCIGSTANDCITCTNPNMILVGLTCQASCPDGQFNNTKTGFCEKCHPVCATCAGSGPSMCSTCVQGLVLSENGGKCTSRCKDGEYRDRDTCHVCHSSCKTCSGPSEGNCLSCSKNQAYYKHSCISNCPSGTFLDNSNDAQLQRCRQCHAVCKTCNGPSADQCTSCKAPLFLENSSCVLQCSLKFTAEENTRVCQPCEDSCPDSPARPKNRSIQDPSMQTLKLLLEDPHKSSLLAFVVMSVALCVVLFFVVFGILQMRSMGLMCWKRRYAIVKTNFKQRSEDEIGLMDDDLEDETA